jgi:hypothetical protein
MARNPDNLPELLISDEADPALSKRIRRLAAAGHVRKLYAGVYTANLDSPPEAVVLRHWQAIVGHLLPGGVLSHRSAFDARPHDGRLVITRGKTRRSLDLPGLTVLVVPGAGAQVDAPAHDVAYGALFLASEPRRYLENLTRGRGWSTRVLPQEELEVQLDRILMIGGEQKLDRLRDQAREIAPKLGYETQFKRLDGLIGALLGTQEAKRLTAKQALARAAGRPYDPARIEAFDELFAVLNRSVLAEIRDPAAGGIARENFAFFEAYFSNYIEGTTFTVEEAESIVFGGRIIENRSEDSHDILGTFRAATTSPWRDRPPASAEDFLYWLKNVNALVMQKRLDRRPGEWKERPNLAGATCFVMPDLVVGTLREGFARVQGLADPIARALMMMFVVTEVHPFTDGNGRTARLAMNCTLTAAGLSRIIIPTVYRDDYLLPLKALSHNADTLPYIQAMTRIHAWSGAFEYGGSRSELRERLSRCNAFEEDLRSYRLLFPERAA